MPCKQKLYMNIYGTHTHTATYSVTHRDTYNASNSCCLFLFLCFTSQSLPSPSLNLIWPISRLAVTLPHMNHNMAKEFSGLQQYKLGSPPAFTQQWTRNIKCSVHTFLAVCTVSVGFSLMWDYIKACATCEVSHKGSDVYIMLWFVRVVYRLQFSKYLYRWWVSSH